MTTVRDRDQLPTPAARPGRVVELRERHLGRARVDVRRFLAEKQAAGLAPKTLQKIRLVLRQILETARGSGAIKANPCQGPRLPRAQQKEPIFLTAEQVDLLARSARPPYDLLLRFAAATGLRPSELCGLRIGRLNLVKGTAEVAEALTVVRGRVEVGPTKTNIRRTVAIPRFLCDDLGAYLAARSQAAGRALTSDDYLFTAPQGGPLRRDLLHKRYFRPAVLKAGLPEGLRVHDLRHTCASILIGLGAHPKVIQERLGHSSIMVTMDVYGHLFPSLNDALTERLDEVFRAARDAPVETAGDRRAHSMTNSGHWNAPGSATIEDMARRPTTVRIDEALLDAARTVAEQRGTTADAVIEEALRRHLALVKPSVVDEVWARQGARPLSAEEAMNLAYAELDAFRAERRASSH